MTKFLCDLIATAARSPHGSASFPRPRASFSSSRRRMRPASQRRRTMLRWTFIALGLLALASAAYGDDGSLPYDEPYCAGNEPYWMTNGVSPPPFGGLWVLPGSLAITAMSLNAS